MIAESIRLAFTVVNNFGRVKNASFTVSTLLTQL
jgi:hypothetical protein